MFDDNSTRYCEDCAHYQAHANPVLAKCLRDRTADTGTLNLVVRNIPVQAARECMTERAFDCGRAGKFFEAKNALR